MEENSINNKITFIPVQEDIDKLEQQFIDLSNSIKGTTVSDSGSISIGTMTPLATWNTAVAFKQPFNSIPNITVSGYGYSSYDGSSWYISSSTASITKSGFVINVRNPHSSTSMNRCVVNWVAQASISSLE